MDNDLSIDEREHAKLLIERIRDAFFDRSVTLAARRELAKRRPEDDELDLVHRLLDVPYWGMVDLRSLPSDGTVVPCLCPSLALADFLPFFLTAILSGVVLGDMDRMFLDTFVYRLVANETCDISLIRDELNPPQRRVAADTLRYLARTCYSYPPQARWASPLMSVADVFCS